MDEKEPIKKSTDESKNVQPDDPLQIGTSDILNPPVEEREESESKLDKKEGEEPKLQESKPEEPKDLSDSVVNVYISGPLSDAQAQKLNPTPKKTKRPLQSSASVDTYGTEESPKTSSDPSIKGSYQKSTESSLDQPSTSGQNPTISSSFDTEENFSGPEDQGEGQNKVKAVKPADNSDLGDSMTPTTTSDISVTNKPESSGLGSFLPSGSLVTSSESSKALSDPSSSSGSNRSVVSSEEDVYEPQVLNRPNTPPPGQAQQELPGDAIEMQEVVNPPQPPPPGGPPPPEENKENPRRLDPVAVVRACCPHAVTLRAERACTERGTWTDYFCIFSVVMLALVLCFGAISPFIALLVALLGNKFDIGTSETFSNETFNNATYANETLNNATYSDLFFSNASHANETFSDESWPMQWTGL